MSNIKMSNLTRGLLGVAIAASGSGVIVTIDDASAAITAGRHNLSSANTTFNRTAGANNEVCVFCHTPHGADTTVAGAPLWNKKFQSGMTFTAYTATSTLDGAYATDGLGGSAFLQQASLACLSCHDGTQAIDNILNAPGSGGLDSTGSGGSGRAYVWSSGNGSGINADGFLQGAAVLGRDLSNDHPIGIRYCGGGPVSAAPTTTCTDPDFTAPSSGGTPLTFWVNTAAGVGNQKEKTDMQLYVRNFASGGAGPSVECASCHDVHSSAALFLRIPNSSSAVCLACHIK